MFRDPEARCMPGRLTVERQPSADFSHPTYLLGMLRIQGPDHSLSGTSLEAVFAVSSLEG